MKKTDFYNDVKTNVEYLSGLNPEAWYKDETAIAVKTPSKLLVSLSCKRNVVTLYIKINGKKGRTVVTDFNTGYKENMTILIAEKISKLLIIDSVVNDTLIP